VSERIPQDGQVVAVNNQGEQLDRLRGLGGGVMPDLASMEAASWRRWLPGGKLPWREVRRFEEEVAKLEARRAEIQTKRLDWDSRLRTSPEADLDRLAEWERSGRRAPRPDPSRPALEAELERLQEDERGLLLAIDRVTEECAAYVDRNRERIVKEARQAVEKAHERAVGALEEAAKARAALVEARQLELWSVLYPAPEVGRQPLFGQLGGGLRRILQKAGLEHIVAADAVISALRDDLDWVASAATPEQRAKLEPREVTQEERERARDSQIDDALRLRGQLAADERIGELARMRGRL